MPRSLLLLLLLFFLSPTLRAQKGTFNNPEPQEARSERTTYMGLRFGVVASQLHGRRVEADHSSKGGLTGGIVVGWRLFRTNALWLESGILYTQKGAVMVGETYADERNEPTPDKSRIRMHYFQFPLLLRVRITAGDMFVCPSFGPYAAIGFGGHTSYAASPEAYDTFRSGAFHRGDWGLRVGLGLAWRALRFDAAYDIGLQDVASPRLADFRCGPASRLRTGALTFTLGVDF